MSGTIEVKLTPPRRCSQCGQAVPPDAANGLCPSCLLAGAIDPTEIPLPLNSGRSFGDFELIDELGRGGMGVVWRARQISLKRPVALKMILQGTFAAEAERRRFEVETQAAAALNHPNIVPIFEVGDIEGLPYYAMKLVSGGSLAQHLGAGPLEPRRAVTLVAQIAAGVHHAHQHGIIHRDLKPANILLEGETPLITDFGLAKRMDRGSELTLSGSVMGSPNYMAPEQAAGQSAEISTATDIYSLGAILFYLLTGQPPFEADTPLATLKLVLESDPPSPRTKERKVDRDLENICLKCLAKQPARRYPSADALRVDLEHWLRREPVQARPAPPWERLWKWTRRHPAVAAGLAAVVLTAALGVAAVRVQFLKTKSALDQANRIALAERSARATVIDPNETLRFDTEARLASFSADGGRLLIAAGTNALIRDFSAQKTLHVLQGHTSFVRLGQWSANGEKVVTASTCQQQPVWDSPLGAYGDQTVRVWDARSGTQTAMITNIFVEPLSSVCLNADGTRVALGSVSGHLGVWQVGENQPLFTTQATTSQVWQVRFAPDDQHLLASSSGDVFWIHRTHPGGGTYGRESCYEENLFGFDMTGRIGPRFANTAKGKMSVFSNIGPRQMPILSSQTEFVFSPDGQRLATASRAPENSGVWDVTTGRRLFGLLGPTNAVSDVAFSHDGQWIAAACRDGTARVWNGANGQVAAILQPHPREVTAVAFGRDPRWLLTACADNRLRIWDVENQVCIALLRGSRGQIRSVEFSADGEEVVSASADRAVRRWRWATLEQMAVPLTRHSNDVKAIRFSTDGQRVVTCSADGEGFVSDTRRGRLQLELRRQSEFKGSMSMTVHANSGGEMRDAAFSVDGNSIVTVWSDPKVSLTRNPLSLIWPNLVGPKDQPFTPGRIWNAQTGQEQTSIPASTVAFVGVELSSDGKRALLLGDEFRRNISERGFGRWAQGSYSHGGGLVAEVVLWDLENQKQIALLDAGANTLRVATFNPKDGRILTASHSLVQTWTSQGGDPQAIDDARGRDWTSFSPDGRWLLSEDENGFPAVWETTRLKKFCSFETLGTNVWEAWLALGGAEIGIISEEGQLSTFDLEKGALLWRGAGSGKNTGVTIVSPDGRWLATVIDKHQVDLWDLQERKLAQTIERHLYTITALSFSPDGQWLGTGDSSGESWLWPLRLAKIQAEARLTHTDPSIK